MSELYETVKTVNGHDIYRMKNTHGFYYVNVTKEKNGCVAYFSFKTIKAAEAFIIQRWAA